jgi:hypothetical protein
MSADPIQPQTFWYTQEYFDSTSVSNWKTRIASFSFEGVLAMNTTASPQVICKGGSCRLKMSVSGGTGNYYYEWKSDPPGLLACGKEVVVTPDSTTKYIARVFDGQFVCNDTIAVTGLPLPSVSAGHDSSYCIYTDAIALEGKASGIISTKWTTSGDGLFSNETSLNTIYFPGFYDKERSAVNLSLLGLPQPPCGQVSSVEHITFQPCPGIGEWTSGRQRVDIFPNPSRGSFSIRLTGFSSSPVSIRLLNPVGDIVASQISECPRSSEIINLSAPVFASGIFILKVRSDNGLIIKKIVINR